MADPIKLVQGDTRPYITRTLTDINGNPLNLSGTSVYLRFRPAGEELLWTELCQQPNGGSDGVIVFNFPVGGLDVDAGNYEGEIAIEYAPGDTQTVYDLMKFKVRDHF